MGEEGLSSLDIFRVVGFLPFWVYIFWWGFESGSSLLDAPLVMGLVLLPF